MSSKATRLQSTQHFEPYDWNSQGARPPRPSMSAPPPPPAPPPSAPAVPPISAIERATIERDAFGQGFAQGERAGAEAAAARSEAVLQRLKQTVGELQSLRAEMIHKTERQVVQLAIAIARRIVHREITLDRELLTAMARVALDRLGESANATIRLHPDDYAATAGTQEQNTGVVRVVADPMVRRGGCMVHSEFGLIDVSADAQIQELATALLGNDDTREHLQAEASRVVA
jgi:flagellar assembly protein FliH